MYSICVLFRSCNLLLSIFLFFRHWFDFSCPLVVCLHFCSYRKVWLRWRRFEQIWANSSICECQQCKRINLYEKNQHGKFPIFVCVFYWLAPCTIVLYECGKCARSTDVPEAFVRCYFASNAWQHQRSTFVDDDMVDVFTSLSHLIFSYPLLIPRPPSLSLSSGSLNKFTHLDWLNMRLHLWICVTDTNVEYFVVTFDRRVPLRVPCRKYTLTRGKHFDAYTVRMFPRSSRYFRMHVYSGRICAATMKNLWLSLPSICSMHSFSLASNSNHFALTPQRKLWKRMH